MRIFNLIADLVSGRIHNTLNQLNNKLKAQPALLYHTNTEIKMTENERKLTQATQVIGAMVTAFGNFKTTMEEKVATLQEQAEDGNPHDVEDLSQEFDDLQIVLDEGQRFVDAINRVGGATTTAVVPNPNTVTPTASANPGQLTQDPTPLAGSSGATDTVTNPSGEPVQVSPSEVYANQTQPGSSFAPAPAPQPISAEFVAPEPTVPTEDSTLPIQNAEPIAADITPPPTTDDVIESYEAIGPD